MSYDEKVNRTRCDNCGCFMKYSEKWSSWVFVPDSSMSYEEVREQCRKCTDKYGPLLPNQNVVVNLCSGVVT